MWVILTVEEEDNHKVPIYQVGGYQGNWYTFHATQDKDEAIGLCSKLNGGK